MAHRWIRSAAGTVAITVLAASAAGQAGGVRPGSFLDSVVSFRAGSGAGFGQDRLPDIVLGPPEGTGLLQGSFDVVSLGNGGEIVVRFGGDGACDGPGPDFLVFENAFHSGSAAGPVFVEAGIVSVSADGESFVEMPYDATTFEGLAGRAPVFSNSDNRIDPADPALAGGDAFDLAAVGVAQARYLRIVDPGDAIADPGNRTPPGINGGFDLDAAVVLNRCGAPTPTAAVSATPTATATATTTPTVVAGDLNDDGVADLRDSDHLIAEVFDGDGDETAAVGGGRIASRSDVDTNGDATVGAADLLGLPR